MIWETIAAPPGLAPPRPMTVRAQSIPARHYFPEHEHRWNQVVYAISGVLTVAVEGRSFVISPEQALIVEAAEIEGQEDRDGYASRVTGLILDQLRRARPLPGALPWPRGGSLAALCEALYADPADPRGSEEWGRELGMSGRTLARRFEAEVGMSLRSWRRRLRLFKAIELLGGGLSVTQTAMELGYGSTSAFVYAFRTEMGCSPQAYMRGRGAGRGERQK